MKINDQYLIKEYYAALLERRSDYVGVFYVGVKTTSVFCIATCRARKPKFENTDFFSDFKTALDYGYRPCKVCCPTENAATAPQEVLRAIQLAKNSIKNTVSDNTLREYGLRPEFIRRWFKKHYNMSFHAYQRMNRINHASVELKHKSVTNTAFDSSYQSLSGFGYTYKKLTGKSPSQNTTGNIVIDRLTTPLGPMFVCATEAGVCLLEFTDRKMLETEFADLQKRFNAPILSGKNTHTETAKTQISAYFSGDLKHFSINLDFAGTQFQQTVWHGLCDIPYGYTRSYSEQAAHINKPKAVRAVAAANGLNKISIIVPCHRVIGKDGALVGYGGGLARKRWLLEHEKKYSL